jgi:general secretion pathway protein J
VTDGPDSRESGFTLIEVMISLALFALISMAGIAVVDAVVGVEERTAGRLERLGKFQRTMFLLSRDLEQISAGSLEQIEGGIRFQRQGASVYDPPRTLGFALRGDGLFRLAAAEQLLIDKVAGVEWSFFFPGRGWQKALPTDPNAPEYPSALAVEILLDETANPSGSLRRVVELPTPPAPTQPAPAPVMPAAPAPVQ